VTLSPTNFEAHHGPTLVLTFRDGKIIRQHAYDCFDPF